MIALSIALMSVVIIVAVALVRKRVADHKRFREITARPSRLLPDDRLWKNLTDMWLFERVFGCWFAAGRWFGNCFSPAVVLEWKGIKKAVYSERLNQTLYPMWASLTLRDRHGTETIIRWHGWHRWGWNSEYIAERWGKHSDHSQHGGPPDMWQYRGWLGNHVSL